jgi:1-acyl-sn-glycerol-3-phosphate acyltransferase
MARYGLNSSFSDGVLLHSKREQKLKVIKLYDCSNHTSMADIMLMLAIVKKILCFVGKQELAKIPLFGFFKRTCIFSRSRKLKSRMEVLTRPKKELIVV